MSDPIRDALQWTAATLQAACGMSEPIRESGAITIGDDERSVAAILDAADAALAAQASEQVAPSDDELIQFVGGDDGEPAASWTFDRDEIVWLCRNLLSRYGQAPAASVEPRPDEYTYFADWYSKDAPDESEVRPFDMARHAWLAALRFADLFPLATPVAAQVPTMNDAIADGDGTLHGAIDCWQSKHAEAVGALRELLEAVQRSVCEGSGPAQDRARAVLAVAQAPAANGDAK